MVDARPATLDVTVVLPAYNEAATVAEYLSVTAGRGARQHGAARKHLPGGRGAVEAPACKGRAGATGLPRWRSRVGALARLGVLAMTQSPLLRVSDLSVRFGGVVALAGVSLDLAPRAIVGLIGPNGAGKTTLFNVLSGLQHPDRGRVLPGGRDITAASPPTRARLCDAHAASRQLNPHRNPPLLHAGPPLPGAQVEDPPGRAGAQAWFDAEHHDLLAALRLSAATADHRRTWLLAWCLDTHLYWRGDHQDPVQRGAAAAPGSCAIAGGPAPSTAASAHAARVLRVRSTCCCMGPLLPLGMLSPPGCPRPRDALNGAPRYTAPPSRRRPGPA